MQPANLDKMGENIAAKYLAGLNYLILIKNHKERFDEIAIIARHPEGALIFCEVKTSTIHEEWINSNNRFNPEDHLDPQKLRRLIKGAQMFLARNNERVPDLFK